jgi:hypothetical protein
MYIDGLNEEFAPPSEAEDGSDAKRAEIESGLSPDSMPRSYRDTTPEPETRVLTPEEEERVKRQHERYMKAAPVPGFGAADSSALEAAGFQVRKV